MSSVATGTLNPNVLPVPTSLRTQMVPPCSSTIRLPEGEAEAGALLAVEWPAALLKRLEDSFLVLGGMPMPVSATVTTRSFPCRSADTDTDPPSGVNLTALDSRLTSTCLILSSSA